MSRELLIKEVIKKCETWFAPSKIEKVPKTKIHEYIIDESGKQLLPIIRRFRSSLAEISDYKEKQEFINKTKGKYASTEFKELFDDKANVEKDASEKNPNNSKNSVIKGQEKKLTIEDKKKKKIELTFEEKLEDCVVKGSRATTNLFAGEEIEDKSLDFYCTFLGFDGWNHWMEKFASSYSLTLTRNPEDSNSTVSIYTIRNPPKELNAIPKIETDRYVLRINILEKVFNLFQQGNKNINITGISGIGKTFLAKHFIEHYKNTFNHIIWLNCSKGLIYAFTEGDGIGLLDNLGLADKFKSFENEEIQAEKLFKFIISRLRNYDGRNLLILDNADESIYNYEDEINLNESWNIIATSQEVLDGFCTFSAPDFQELCIELFYKFYTLEQDNDNLIRLLIAVEYHTLVIELLAKTAQERKLSIIALVNRFTEKGINVVEKAKVITKHNKERGLVSIENIEEYLNIIFDLPDVNEEKKENEEECKILLNIALLQNDSIPMVLFQEVYLNNATDKKLTDIFSYTINTLIRKGWIQTENERIRIHSLVKSIIIKRFSDRNDFFDSTVKYLTGKSKIESDTQTNIKKLVYLTFSESLLENIKEKNKDTLFLKDIVTSFYIEIGLYEKANKIELDKLDQLLKSENISKKKEIVKILYTLSALSHIQRKDEDAIYFSMKLFSYFENDVQKKLYHSLKKSLTSFFSKNKIDNIVEFEKIFVLSNDFETFEMILFSSYIVIQDQFEKDLNKTIHDLETLTLTIQDILTIFKKNIPEKIILHIKVYRMLLSNNAYFFRRIGFYYLELKQFDRAEEFTNKTLEIALKLSNEDDASFSYLYNQFTKIYIESGNIESARYYLEKNAIICGKIPPNHPAVILYKKDIIAFEELELKTTLSNNINRIIESEFNLLFEKSPNFTDLIDYYSILSSRYFICKEYEKANEYVKKEIDFRLNTDKNKIDYLELINLYVNSGYCYFYLNDFERALELHNVALHLYKEKGVKDVRINHNLLHFRNVLLRFAFQSNHFHMISLLIKIELNELEEHYINSIQNSPAKDKLLSIIKNLFVFLYDLPNLRETLECIKPNKENMNLFLTEYDAFYVKILKDLENLDHLDSYTMVLHYSILAKYYVVIINLFFKNEKWDVALGYSIKHLFLNEERFKESETRGYIYYINSYCYFKLENFVLALEEIHKSILIYSRAAEDANNEIEIIKLIKSGLKDALDLEKSIKEEIGRYRKQ